MMMETLQSLGFTRDECEQLRRISMQLHSWHERECGTDNGCIERDETTGKAYWLNSHSMRRYPIRDMEAGALRRLQNIVAERNDRAIGRVLICESENEITVKPYVQTDPRGAALYIIRPQDVPEGASVESF
jgi:hypothetical protein